MKELSPYEEQIVNDIIMMRTADLKVEANQKKVIEANAILFDGEICATCPGDITNAYYRIRTYVIKPIQMKKQISNSCNFQLNDGAIVIDPQDGEMYTNANLTDDVAARVLAKYPGAAKRFKNIPDWVATAAAPSPEQNDSQAKQSAVDYVKDESRTREELTAVALENGMEESKIKKLSTEKLRKDLLKKLE